MIYFLVSFLERHVLTQINHTSVELYSMQFKGSTERVACPLPPAWPFLQMGLKKKSSWYGKLITIHRLSPGYEALFLQVCSLLFLIR